MAKTVRQSLILIALIMVLVGCAGGTFAERAEAITDQMVVREMRYFDEGELGDTYAVMFTVPDEWVGQFETSSDGAAMTVSRVEDNGRRAPIFTVFALSRQQWWEQGGAYPQSYPSLKSTPDTYFTYNAPIEAFYSGLERAEFEALRAALPDIVASFDVVPSDEMVMMN